MEKIIVEKAKCTGCFACLSICPTKSILMQADSEGFWYPKIDSTSCIECNLCRKCCPVISKENGSRSEKLVVAAKSKNEASRLKSSSGGIFSLLSEAVLVQEGVVYGAALSEDCKSVFHVGINQKRDLWKLQGSKYVHSKIGNCYKEAKKDLESGRKVLFTGTPCQIEGLRSYLRKEYDNLYLQDVVCHGVPSPLVWRRYIEYREMQARGSVERIYFRHKKYGWNMSSLLLEFSNGRKYIGNKREDLYLRGFLANLFLRPSCYQCSFKGLDRNSDITLADFWGIDNIFPNMNDDKGISAVMINSEKGGELFDKIKDKIIFQETEIAPALTEYNSAATKSVKVPLEREEFMSKINQTDINILLQEYVGLKKKQIIEYRVRYWLSRIKRKLLAKDNAL